MQKQFDLIVFDWDGTLMDSEAKIVNCIQAAATDCDLQVPTRNAARRVIGLGLHEALSTLFPTQSTSRLEMLVARYRQHFLHDDKTEMVLFPGVREGLASLVDQGYLLAVATGKARRGLQKVLRSTETAHLFISTRCADETFSKPHPQMLEEILAESGVGRQQALMVGDTTYDMQMACNAGVARLAVSYGVHTREQLLEHEPLACLDNFAEVRGWLN